jgi:arylsulfatase A-like enzyme
MLGDHNVWGKSKPYQESVGVPLVVRGPGILRGATCRAPSTTLDITATILERAGIPLPSDMESRPLWPVLEGRAGRTRDHVVSGLGTWRMVIRDRYKFIRGFGEGPLLFDMLKDPGETDNLALKMPEVAEDLGRILQAECK